MTDEERAELERRLKERNKNSSQNKSGKNGRLVATAATT